MSRYRRKSGSISIDVDVDEVLSEVSDDDLIAECHDRNLQTDGSADDPEQWRDFAEDLRTCVGAGDSMHLEVLIIRMLAMAGVPRLTIIGAKTPA